MRPETSITVSLKRPAAITVRALLWLYLSTACFVTYGQEPPGSIATPLEVGKTIESDLVPAQKQSYAIAADAGQYIAVRVRSETLKFGVALIAPSGERIVLLGPPESSVDAKVDFVAASPGKYRLEVYAWHSSPRGHYNVALVEARLATWREKGIEEARQSILKGIRLTKQNKFPEAKAAIAHCLQIREKLYGPNDATVADALSYLSFAYSSSGDLPTAIDLKTRSLAIRETAIGKADPEIAQIVFEISSLYIAKGDFLSAEPLLLRSLDILDHAHQGDSLVAGLALATMGDLSYRTGDLTRAADFYHRALAVNEKILGPDHYHLVTTLLVTGQVEFDSGNAVAAEKAFHRALEITEKTYGLNDWRDTQCLNDLGNLYLSINDFGRAADVYDRALKINASTGDNASPRARDTFFGIARMYAAEGMMDKALSAQSTASESEERGLSRSLTAGSEREKLAALAILYPLTDENVSLHLQKAPDDPAYRDLALTTILRRKGRILDFIAFGNESALAKLTPDERKLFGQLDEATARLSNLVLRGPETITVEEYQSQIRDLEGLREHLENQINQRNIGFLPRSTPVSIEEVSKQIPADAVLVEFVGYRPFHLSSNTFGHPRYAVYSLKPNGEINARDLGDAEEIDSAVERFRLALRDARRNDVKDLARSLDEKLMQPVRRLVGKARHLFISPDGELNVIPFDALVDEEGKYLIENFTFTYLSSGRDLLRIKHESPSKNNPVIFGNPQFGSPRTDLTSKSKIARKPQVSITNVRTLSDTYFAPLAGSDLEGRSILSLFPNAKYLTGAAATESALKHVSAPSILHIATHGFFLEDPNLYPPNQRHYKGQGVFDENIQDPLLRSGLALAGANRRSAGAGDDGLMTSLEASGLNLWGTELVVLSACDTGLGEIRNGEGVYGLRRAFGIAGAESIVMSLWPISDQTTRDLMITYYKNLKDGLGRTEALRAVQLEMLGNPQRSHPFYWASFIQSGNWAPLKAGSSGK